MKIRKRDYLYTLWDVSIGRPIKSLLPKIRYFFEMGGKGGYYVNDAPGYWGRYGSPEKIAELASDLYNREDSISFYLPAIQYDYKYSHQINIWGSDSGEDVLIEFIYASNQCG